MASDLRIVVVDESELLAERVSSRMFWYVMEMTLQTNFRTLSDTKNQRQISIN